MTDKINKIFEELVAAIREECLAEKGGRQPIFTCGNAPWNQYSPISDNVRNEGWIKWDGGECPVPDGSEIEYKMKGSFKGFHKTGNPEELCWSHINKNGDIAEYRIIELADQYGNTESNFRNCCFPDCGCDGARLCMAPSGPNSGSCAINIERGSVQS